MDWQLLLNDVDMTVENILKSVLLFFSEQIRLEFQISEQICYNSPT